MCEGERGEGRCVARTAAKLRVHIVLNDTSDKCNSLYKMSAQLADYSSLPTTVACRLQ